MVSELNPEDFHRARPVFRSLSFNLAICSVLNGVTRGRVFVDDEDNPRNACVWTTLDSLYLEGDAGDPSVSHAFHSLFTEALIPGAKQRGIPELSIIYAPDAWESHSRILMQNLLHRKGWRKFYKLGGHRLDWRARIPEGFAMRAIDENALARDGLANAREMRGWVDSFWRAHYEFASRGVGCFLASGDTVISWCLSVYASGNQVELGVATAQGHRNKGYASLAAAACLECCDAKGLSPTWHCSTDNLPSIAVAEKIGFQEALRYPAYRIWT